ncbi:MULTISPECIES: hypothetical protein [unclassified Bradyrhizobium]
MDEQVPWLTHPNDLCAIAAPVEAHRSRPELRLSNLGPEYRGHPAIVAGGVRSDRYGRRIDISMHRSMKVIRLKAYVVG